MTAAAQRITAVDASKGHNKPPVLTPDELAKDFSYINDRLADIDKMFDDCPSICEDEADLEVMRAAVRQFVGAQKRLETLRVESKEPFLSATRIVDGFFNPLKERFAKYQTAVEARAKRYLDKKAAEEKARREEEARKAAEEARHAAEAARKAEAERIEQERLAAEKQAEADGEAAEAARARMREQETRAREAALRASATALQAQKEAKAKPAELARTRTGDGLSTLQEEFCWEVTDPHAIKYDDPVLRSFIPFSVIETALNRYTKVHKDQRPLDGVRFFKDTKVRMT